MDNRLTSALQPTVVSLFSRTISRDAVSDDELIALVESLQDKSFAWPTPNDDKFADASSENYTQTLNILLDPGVTWQAPIWFRCHLFWQQKGRRGFIRLSTSSVGYVTQMLQNMFPSYDSYYTYVSLIGSLIFSRREPTSEFLSFVRRSRKMQEDVFCKFTNVFTDPLFEPKKVPLGKMPLLVRRLTVDDGLRALQKVYDADPRIDRSDVVLATNSRLLVTMNDLLEAYTTQEITFYTIWWFAQYVCTITSRVLFNAVSNAQFGAVVQIAYCAALSKEFYHVHWADQRLTFYDPVTNRIPMTTDAIGPPLYYSSGTSAKIYGNLGFVYSVVSYLIRDELSKVSAQSPDASFSEAPSCANVHLLFPELPALDLAHEAYFRFRDAQKNLPLKGLGHSTCLFYPDGTTFSPRCNEAVKNFAPFAKAFSCQEGSQDPEVRAREAAAWRRARLAAASLAHTASRSAWRRARLEAASRS
ncbi:hypothetical protein HPB52_008567 [Rhipicephalus sanguineus]|uniref:Uncharacterized protein n=1 Tax=Rhipicephalus sanguineus TaxID=34632 RepID=A0A9D4PLH5_RHISA|nr:hypothetical protein HPB52_008567 [Rhipicephalus sanguineus]